ncbi:hypothetical protein V8F33_013727 [Rhypophila sp. PSN 637]
MPNYEPTPRRFSTLSVPQTPSRRNSFDDACRPSLAITDAPVFPPLGSPMDLSILLKRLQQTPRDIETTETAGDNVERGRSRQSARHKRSATAWSHHDSTEIQVPAARRRENSASTRDRIAMWEERSRSQSKGRSKSRGRDLGHTGSRISVVPEMPEIASALARLVGEDTIEAEENETENWQQSPVVEDNVFSPIQQLHHDRQTWANGMANSPPPSPETVSANSDDRIDVLHIDRPQTPLATMPALLPTPDATPRQLVSGKRELSLSSVPAIHPELEDSPTLIPTSPSLPRNQREVIATEVQMGVRFITEETQEAPTLPPRPLGADGIDETRTSNQDTWRISNYRPEFPLPARPTVQTTLDHATLARAPFDGTPLQKLPRSQLSKSAEAYRPPPELHMQLQADPYPYSGSASGGGGDFAIDILPSPTSAYHRIPNDFRPAGPNRRQSRSGPSQRNDVGAGSGRNTFREVDLESGSSRHEWDTPPVIERAFHAASVSIFQSLAVPMGLYRGFRDNYYPPPERPDIIKAYPVRRRLPIRIFFPSYHDLTSPALLPTLFTIHGGGFTVGYASDDDKWNRTFADSYTIMVISLNYSKAPWACFPAPLHDVEALYHAVLNDESLPIDRMRTALCGFDAGANLALALSQLPSVQTGREPSPRPPPPAALDPKTGGLQSPISPSITAQNQRSQNLNRHRSIYFRTGGPSLPPQGYQPSNPHPASFPYYQPPLPLKSHPPPSAVIPICGILDFTTSASEKSKTRPYKRPLRGPRGWGPGLDLMARTLPSSAWSYIPYGHDTSDPLLSPLFARRKDLPPHVFVIGAELDCLAHESWRSACNWASSSKGGNAVGLPDEDAIVGRKAVSRWRGCLDDGAGLDADKFGWVVYHGCDNNNGSGSREEEEEEDRIVGSTRWLLVPDVVHGFDSAPWRNKYLWGDEQARMDAEMKTIAYQSEMAEWLWGTVWNLSG